MVTTAVNATSLMCVYPTGTRVSERVQSRSAMRPSPLLAKTTETEGVMTTCDVLLVTIVGAHFCQNAALFLHPLVVRVLSMTLSALSVSTVRTRLLFFELRRSEQKTNVLDILENMETTHVVRRARVCTNANKRSYRTIPIIRQSRLANSGIFSCKIIRN